MDTENTFWLRLAAMGLALAIGGIASCHHVQMQPRAQCRSMCTPYAVESHTGNVCTCSPRLGDVR